MNTKTLQDNQVDDDTYQPGKWTTSRIFLLIMGSCLLGLFFHFPIINSLEGFLATKLNKNRACPIFFSKLSIGLFLPKIQLFDPEISPRCFGKSGANIPLKNVDLSIRRPSFSPPGVMMTLSIKDEFSEIIAYPSFSFTKMAVRVEDTKIKGPSISKWLGKKNVVKGEIDLNSYILAKYSGYLIQASVSLKSDDVFFKGSEINPLIPNLSLGPILLEGEMIKDNTFEIKNLKLGKNGSPIEAYASGQINLNQKNLASSGLNLNTQVKFSQDFLNRVSILNLLLAKAQKEGDFYKIDVQGSLQAPIPKF